MGGQVGVLPFGGGKGREPCVPGSSARQAGRGFLRRRRSREGVHGRECRLAAALRGEGALQPARIQHYPATGNERCVILEVIGEDAESERAAQARDAAGTREGIQEPERRPPARPIARKFGAAFQLAPDEREKGPLVSYISDEGAGKVRRLEIDRSDYHGVSAARFRPVPTGPCSSESRRLPPR